jgi:hypothetical protein
MASLRVPTGREIAIGSLATPGKAEFTIDPTGGPGKVEIWERIIPFPPPGSVPPPPPAFGVGGVYASTTPLSKSVSLASLYQVRLYREGEGNAAGVGNVLDQLNFPCVLEQAGRSNFLTQCAHQPQLAIKVGGTFVSLDFAASKLTMSRAQLATKIPVADVIGLPVFPDGSVVATAHSASTGPKLLHTLALSDARMLPGNSFFFVILVWDSNGNWDFVWDPDVPAPLAPPKTITSKKRSVDVRLTKLHYLDDSDSLTNGEGSFTLVVQQKEPPVTKTLGVGTFESGTNLEVIPPVQITLGPEVVTADIRKVSVQVKGVDDDSGTPFDDDDPAATGLIPLDFPTGEGKEEVIDRLLALTGNPSGGDDDLRFVAEVLYSVTYL